MEGKVRDLGWDPRYEFMYEDNLDFELDQEPLTGREGEEEYGDSVLVHVGPLSFTISIGEGTQTVKWLSLAASMRYSQYVMANGKQAKRDDILLDAGSFVPSCVTLGGKVVSPDKILRDVIERKHPSSLSKRESKSSPPEFTVELAQKVGLRDDGGPQLQKWKSQAFCHSSAGKEHVKALLVKAGELQDEETVEGGENGSKGNANKFLAPGVFTVFDGPEDVAAQVESDWDYIKTYPLFRRWFHTAEYEKLDVVKEQAVKSAILNTMDSLCFLTDHYSWQWRREKACTVSVMECKHLFHYAGLVQLPQDDEKLDDCINDVFKNSNDKLKVKTPTHRTMLLQRYQVILVVLTLATKTVKPSGFATEVTRLFKEKLLPAGAALSVADKSVLVRRVFSKSTVARIFRGKTPQDKERALVLQKVFKHYCIQASTNGKEPTMLVREFNLFVKDSMPRRLKRLRNDREGKDEDSSSSSESSSESSSDDEDDEEKRQSSVQSLRAAQQVFDQAQVLNTTDQIPPLQTMVLAEFVTALLILLYKREKHADTWDSTYGARRFVQLINVLAAQSVDDDEDGDEEPGFVHE